MTPFGSSDSHDVARYLAGQARTYIKGNDDDAGGLQIAEIIQNFRNGSVLVSFGLLTEVLVNKQFGPGDLAPVKDSVQVQVKVLGPKWAEANHVTLYANGQKVGERKITHGRAAGVKWSGTWVLPKLNHGVFFLAGAEGPGRHLPFWPIAKLYSLPHQIGNPGLWAYQEPCGWKGTITASARALTNMPKNFSGNTRAILRNS